MRSMFPAAPAPPAAPLSACPRRCIPAACFQACCLSLAVRGVFSSRSLTLARSEALRARSRRPCSVGLQRGERDRSCRRWPCRSCRALAAESPQTPASAAPRCPGPTPPCHQPSSWTVGRRVAEWVEEGGREGGGKDTWRTVAGRFFSARILPVSVDCRRASERAKKV
eukprot:3529650-Rhodomonas_salina.2